MESWMKQILIVTLHLISFCPASLQDRSGGPGASGPLHGAGRWGPCVRGGGGGGGGVGSCCPGWRNVNGACQPLCRKPCVQGTCTLPGTCTCSSGYKGPQCDRDVNECGAAERACDHRCMNTPGSYRCYCAPGYELGADRRTCSERPGCSSLRCQFGCQGVAGGSMSCTCPPGLSLTADNRTCEDLDECVSQAGVCGPRRVCRNTFGSYVCVCQAGFVMGTRQGAMLCRDRDECVTGSHGCSRHARCTNTVGSYACRCAAEFSGDGRTCRPRGAPPPPRPHAATMLYRYKLSRRTRPLLGPPAAPAG